MALEHLEALGLLEVPSAWRDDQGAVARSLSQPIDELGQILVRIDLEDIGPHPLCHLSYLKRPRLSRRYDAVGEESTVGIVARTVDAIVEIPRGSRSKYELDPVSGRLRLDRVLHASVHYPTDYGFIPETVAGDGDHLDALIIVEEPAVPNSMHRVRPIGLLDMTDEKGSDSKVLAVPTGDPRFDSITKLSDLAPHWLAEIEYFFKTYKALEDKQQPTVKGWRGAEAAWEAIETARQAYADQQHAGVH